MSEPPRHSAPSSAGVAVIIPTLNEADAIAAVIQEIPRTLATEIIVADSGSRDGTQAAARAAGARVLDVQQRGYGLACARAAAAADPACSIIVFLDGDGADRADLMAQSKPAPMTSSSPPAPAASATPAP